MTEHEHDWRKAGEVSAQGSEPVTIADGPTTDVYRCECGAWRLVTTWGAYTWADGYHVTHEQEMLTEPATVAEKGER